MAVDKLLVNGNQYSWASAVIKISGENIYGITSISYNDKRERVKAYGTGKHHAPRGRSRGKYSTDASKMTCWTSTAQDLRNMLASQSPDGVSYGDTVFQVVVQYAEDDETAVTVELVDCVLASQDTSNEESPDPLKEEITFDVMRIRRNGLTLYDSSEGPA